MSARVNAGMLRQIPLFAECDPGHLQVLAFASERTEFPAGVTMMTAGDANAGGLLVLSGLAEIWVGSDAGPEVVATAPAGTLLGELGMIAGIAASINVRSATSVVAARITRRVFARVVEEFPEFGASVVAALAQKLDNAIEDFSAVRRLFDEGNRFSVR